MPGNDELDFRAAIGRALHFHVAAQGAGALAHVAQAIRQRIVGRDGETDAIGAAGVAQNGRVDPDDAPGEYDAVFGLGAATASFDGGMTGAVSAVDWIGVLLATESAGSMARPEGSSSGHASS